jgi:tRNA (adenine37-N6)-methyltransferase
LLNLHFNCLSFNNLSTLLIKAFNLNQLIIEPIGIIHSEQKFRYETPRQGVLETSAESYIELNAHLNFEQAVKDLDGFERIWVIYQFHLNANWKPLVQPPRHTRNKVGVFATRAPYRPNPVGMSCVKLNRVEGLKIFISNSDILDGSPVIDIKPYLPYSDSFPEAKTGWVKHGLEEICEVVYSEQALLKINWLKKNGNINLKSFAKLQLEFNPKDNSRKRIQMLEEGSYILSYRTWRIKYSALNKSATVSIEDIFSGYSESELHNSAEDKYEDKALHRKFNATF